MILRKNVVLFCLISLLLPAALFVLSTTTAHAEGRVAVFFRGICRANRQTACVASETARTTFGTAGLNTVITPAQDNDGCLAESPRNVIDHRLAQGRDFVLIAFSGGSCALNATVQAMTREERARVKSLVSLDATSEGFNTAVRTIQAVNRSVEVHRYSSDALGIGHDAMPGSSGLATAIARITAGQNPGTVVAGTITTPPYNPRDRYTRDRSLASLFQPGPPSRNTGLLGGLGSGLSSFASLFSSFVPQQGALTSPYTPVPLPAGLSALSSTPIPVPQASPPIHITSSVSTANSGNVSNQTNTSNVSTQTVNNNTNTQQNNSSTFAQNDTVRVSYSPSTPSQTPPPPPFASNDLRTTLTNILLKTRDILQSLVSYLQR